MVPVCVEDITERKRVKQALRESEERYRGLVETMNEGLNMLDENGLLIYANDKFCKMLGYSRDEIIGHHISEFVDKSNQNILKEQLGRERKCERVSYELARTGKDGRKIFTIVSAVPILDADGNFKGSFAVVTDITERKRVEEALQKSEASLVEAQQIAHLGNWDWDIEKNELSWSDEIYRIFGLEPQEFGATFEAFLNSVHPDDKEFVKKSINEALHERKPYFIDHRIVLPDGTERIVHTQDEVFRDETGKPIRMVGTVQDITERKRAEEALRESLERHRAFVVASKQIVLTTNADGEVDADIPVWREFTGQSEEAVKGWGWMEAVHPDDRERVAPVWKKAVAARSPYEIEYRVRKHDGSYRHFLARGTPVLGKDGRVWQWVGTCTDITGLKRAEDELKARVEELEEFHEVVVGRELKMKQMEAELERLMAEFGEKK